MEQMRHNLESQMSAFDISSANDAANFAYLLASLQRSMSKLENTTAGIPSAR